MDLSILVNREDEITILSIQGEMDDFHAPKLNDAFNAVIERDACKKLIVDLDGTSFIDSVGLGTLALAGKKMKLQQGQVGLVCTRPQILRLLNASGIVDALPNVVVLYDTIDDAKGRI